ncbi:hypothetical protein LINPERHAP1_LOCUS12535, partial [Linum perenne]
YNTGFLATLKIHLIKVDIERDSKLVFSYLKKTNHQCLRWNCDGGIFCIKIDAPWWHFQTVRRPEIAWRQ